MCPGAIRFWRDLLPRNLFASDTENPNQELAVKANPTRVAFVIASQGGLTYARLAITPPGSLTAVINPLAATQQPQLTIATYGPLMFQPWTFTFANGSQYHEVWELNLPKDFE